ncbi:MAG: PAS domain-containing protein [Acetobacteraceae bacterium]|nr:PAS domain-containing protein [Acetobacteraceae bacterium]
MGRETALLTRPYVREARQGRMARFRGWRTYPSAERRYVDSVYAPVLRADGRMDGYFVLVRDLTEQRRREEELAQRNRQLEEMLDAVPARVCLTDLDRRYRYVNREFCEFAGKRPDEILGMTSEELVGPEVSGLLTPFVRAAQAGRTVTREGWVNYRTSGPKYITWVFTPKRAADGSVEGVLLFMRDSTELKRHEEELARRTAQLETILASIAEGVNVVDGAGRLVLCNRGFLDLYGFPEELGRPGTPLEALARDRLERGLHYAYEARGRPVEALAAERATRVFEGGDRVEQELRADGRWLEIRYRHLGDGTVVLTYTDVTARHEAEFAKRAQHDALRRAEQFEATASLLAGVAHEINNPLAVVAAQAMLLAEEAAGTEFAARAEKVCEAAQRCGRIVASLTASARRRAHRREEVDLAQAVATGLDLAGYGLRTAGVALEQRVPLGLPRLLGDPDQLAHLVSNLVANAQAALEGAPPPRRLALTAARLRDALELRVADNGPGIPEALRERVFAPFFTTKPAGVGTGVGLALCRAVASAHGGSIWAETTPGGGATLVVRLPLPDQASRGDSTAADGAGAGPHPPKGDGADEGRGAWLTCL